MMNKDGKREMETNRRAITRITARRRDSICETLRERVISLLRLIC